MPVLTHLPAVYAALDGALAAYLPVGNVDQDDTIQHIVTKLKNRRGLLSELVNSNSDATVQTHASTPPARVMDHL